VDVPADAGLLSDKAALVGATIKEYFVTTCVLVVCGAEFKARCIRVCKGLFVLKSVERSL
jgi:hypothetical protein